MSDLGATFAGVVTHGSLLLAMAVAALAGLISFASPCCLPLIPGYVSYVAGLAGSQATAGRTRVAAGGPPAPSARCSAEAGPGFAAPSPPPVGRGRVLAGSLLFIVGFSAVFVSFGALFGGLGRLLLE